MSIAYQNKWYSIAFRPTGTIYFTDSTASTIFVKSIGVWNQILTDGREETLNRKLHWRHKGDDSAAGEFNVYGGDRYCDIVVKIRCKLNSPQVDFYVESSFSREVKIIRHALLFDFDIPVTAIIKKNRQIQESNFADRYWIDKQGVIFGDKEAAAFIYHTPVVSSLEVVPGDRRLIVNLDYCKDHPQVTANGDGGFCDSSYTCQSPGKKASYRFALIFGYMPPLFLRLMAAPSGFLATHVWTEHACHSDLRIQRAVYYGSESIEKPNDAMGGFVRHNIPVTKSVFYDNEMNARSEDPDGVFCDSMVAIKKSPAFESFLRDLYASGCDICLHCAQPQTSSGEKYEEALEYMKKNFNSVCWIDHLWYRPEGITTGCREAVSCEGLDPSSQYFMEPIWLHYGTQFFWSYSSELLKRKRRRWTVLNDQKYKFAVYNMLKSGRYYDSVLYTMHKIGCRIKKKLERFGKKAEKKTGNSLNIWGALDRDANPIYWTRPAFGDYQGKGSEKSGCICSWATLGAYFPGVGEDPYMKKELEHLIDKWGVCISHAYPVSAYLGSRNAAWQTNQEGKVMISGHFDNILSNMNELRRQNKLHVTTIRDLMGYWLSLEKIKIEYRSVEENIRIYNFNNHKIRGLSFACKSANVFVNGSSPELKRIKEEVIFWFDIDSLSYVTISDMKDRSGGQGKIWEAKY